MNKPPIFFVTGAAGTGKTAIIPALYELCPNQIVIDMDALYPTLEDWFLIKNLWVHLAHQLYLNKRATIISGMYFPWEYNLADLKEQFTPYFIGLYCSHDTIKERLLTRGWSEEKITDQQHCNQWVIDNANTAFYPEMPLIDTSYITPYAVGKKVKKIIHKILHKNSYTIPI